MNHLYLDDYRACPAGFILARNAEECKLMLKELTIGILSLDFDLGYGEPTGLDVVEYMVSEQIWPQEVYLHTSSNHGRMQMYRLLSQHAPMTMELHYGPMPDEVKDRVARQAE
ncbi:cell division protein FtsJ [Paenibacillus cellulosilyticus]|uniref:cyclic-phosphate processing receiver domain-containing protein n=1 Tax=Paenibacillus cellulosilyticus TaxID=375489 RepID=UPI000D71CACF|nr:cyclic-phosphate processing receiver domain-containing protein [Paenibacillus cellulosilyticus]QKS45551.1 cell division protein FtsJ [Paenibacillus cellulosilyticus]